MTGRLVLPSAENTFALQQTSWQSHMDTAYSDAALFHVAAWRRMGIQESVQQQCQATDAPADFAVGVVQN